MRDTRVSAPPVWVVASLIGLLLVPFYLATSTGATQSIDAAASALPAWSLAREGNPYLDEVGHLNRWLVTGAHGHIVSNRFPGSALLATPVYFLLGARSSAKPTVFPGNVTAALAASLFVALLVVLLAPLLGLRRAVLTAAFVGLATPTWSVASDALWPHAPGQAVLVLLMLTLSRRKWWWSVPLLLTAVLVRPILVVVSPVLAVHHLLRGQRTAASASLLGGAAGLAALAGWNHLLFGSWSLTAGYGNIREPDALPVLGELVQLPVVLLSPLRGVFVLTPVLLLCCVGLRSAWSTAPDWVKTSAVAGVLILVGTFQLTPAAGGDGYYGYRLPLEGLSLLVPLLALAHRSWLDGPPWRRTCTIVAVVWSAASTASGAVLYRPHVEHYNAWTEFDLALLVRHEGLRPVLLVTAGAIGAVLALARRGRRHLTEQTSAVA